MRRIAAGSPPAMIASCPASAAPGPPDTGASTHAIPVRCLSSAAQCLVSSIVVVDKSTRTLACLGASATPFRPSTASSTAWPPVGDITDSITISAVPATSAGDSAGTTPWAAACLTFSGTTSQPTTRKPDATRRLVKPCPISPSPTKPIVSAMVTSRVSVIARSAATKQSRGSGSLRFASLAMTTSILPTASPSQAIEFDGVIVEQLALRGLAEMGHARLEAGVDDVEATAQAVDRIVAGEHAALAAEDGDRVVDDGCVVGELPGAALEPEPGDLERRVRPLGECSQGLPPGGEPLGAAVGGQAGVIEDDRRLRKSGRELSRRVEVPPRRLQIERQPVSREQREAVAPALIVHRSGCAARRRVRPLGRTRFVPDAAHQRTRRLRSEHVGDVVAVEPRLRHHRARQAVTPGEAAHPFQFADRIT